MSKSKELAQALIQDVSDTAFWVAAYRAMESDRSDALFRDPLALRLAGEQGQLIANQISGTNFTAWAVIIRTRMIDDWIQVLLSQGVDIILNLGAGLDSRPYRLDLPSSLKWIEVDFPHMIDFKEEVLIKEKPKCHLERVRLDLALRSARQDLFSRVATQGSRVLVLTEGVVPYLSNDQVKTLADDLRSQGSFRYWIVDYFSPRLMRWLNLEPREVQAFKNAPLQFLPHEWDQFFAEQGWIPQELRYLPIESMQYGRELPIHSIARWVTPWIPKKILERFYQVLGYALLVPKDQSSA